jgi:hypothetical protein
MASSLPSVPAELAGGPQPHASAALGSAAIVAVAVAAKIAIRVMCVDIGFDREFIA